MRQTVELIVMLCLSVRRWCERFRQRPTSFRPARWHRRFWDGIASSPARAASAVFVVGIEDEGQTGEAICPNCGKRGLDDGPSIECGGDRVLVEKFIYEFRRPRRWEVAVFHFPGEPSQAYVKRVVGLPGELIRIKRGDVFVNDRIARKSLAEIRAMRMLVHDSRFQPQNAARVPRWLFRSDRAHARRRRLAAAGNAKAADSCISRSDAARSARRLAGLQALGFRPRRLRHDDRLSRLQRQRAARAQRDQRRRHGSEHRLSQSIEAISVALCSRASIVSCCGFRPRPGGEIELLRNGQRVPISNRSNPFSEKRCGREPCCSKPR